MFAIRAAIVLTALMLTCPVWAGDATIHYYYDSVVSTDCESSSSSNIRDFCVAWYDELTSHTGWNDYGDYDGSELAERRLCDADTGHADCKDDIKFGLDHQEAAMLSTHGFDISGSLQFKPYVDPYGWEDCYSYLNQWELGDQSLDFLVMHVCHAMDDNFWDDWADPMDGLHSAVGFHGIVCQSCDLDTEYQSFVDDTFGTSAISIADS